MPEVEMCTACSWVRWWLIAAVFLYVAPFIVALVRGIYRHKNILTVKPARNDLLALLFFALFLGAAFALHFSTGMSKIHHMNPDEAAYVPKWGEEVFDALFRAFRTFGVPEHFTDFVQDLRAMLERTVENAALHNWVVALVVLVDVSIPLAGSALILGTLARIFPRINLFLKNHNPYRDKHYFSGLNPQSLALARSILEKNKAEKKLWLPLLVFTDAYVDDETEASMELLLEAKRLGAICLRDDLTHVRKSGCKTKKSERNYYLMEEDEYANMPALMGLVDNRNVRFIESSRIYIFVQSDIYTRLERNIRERLKGAKIKRLFRRPRELTDDNLPVLIPVNAHRNLIYNLLVDVPLYEPLVGRNKTELSVTIFGNGSIGTEALLSTYWFGQMQTILKAQGGDMADVALTIHVVSQDAEDVFWSKIKSFNPELYATTQENDPILKWRPDKPANPRYCALHYHKVNAKIDQFDTEPWLDSDYIIVALGSDADNVTIANKLRAHIGKRHLEKPTADDHTVIAYVVYDVNLCNELNTSAKVEYGIYMHAFGNLKQVYSDENVFMSSNVLLAAEADSAYRRNSGTEQKKLRKKGVGSIYEHQANVARASHINYKLFALGWVKKSRFNGNTADECREELQELRALYRRIVAVGTMDPVDLFSEKQTYVPPEEDKTAVLLSEDDRKRWKELWAKRHMLAWLEHRRWCAHRRAEGFRFTDAMMRNFIEEGEHKNISLKLHPCLVEARHPLVGKARTYVSWMTPADELAEEVEEAKRKAEEATQEAEEAKQKAEEATQKVEEAKQRAEEAKRKADEANKTLSEKYSDVKARWEKNYQGVSDETLWQQNEDLDELDIHHVRRWRAFGDAIEKWEADAKKAKEEEDSLAKKEEEDSRAKKKAKKKEKDSLAKKKAKKKEEDSRAEQKEEDPLAKQKEKRTNLSTCKKYDYFIGEFGGYVLLSDLKEKNSDVAAKTWSKALKDMGKSSYFESTNEGQKGILIRQESLEQWCEEHPAYKNVKI